MLIKLVHQKNVIFVIIGVLKIFFFKYELYLCNGCHDLRQKALHFSDAAIIYVKGSTYRIHF